MIKGFYAAASAMVAGVTQQSLITHNVANMNTPGFKQVLNSLNDFGQVPVVQPPDVLAGSQGMTSVGNLGLGVETTPEKIDFSQGTLQMTSHPLDFALDGPGFFRVQAPDGNGERYTRDGRFVLDSEGNLVTVEGYHVLDDSGSPINMTLNGELTVSTNGTLYVNKVEVARLGVSSFADPTSELSRDQGNLFKASGDPTGETEGQVAQGYLEASNADPASLITRMVVVARQYEAAQQMVQNQDDLLGRSIATLGSLG